MVSPPQATSPRKSPTYGVWLGVRGLLVNGKPDQAVALMKTMRIYPLSKATDPPAMIFLNGSGEPIDTIFPDNYEYFESLAAGVEKEPVDGSRPRIAFFLHRSASRRVSHSRLTPTQSSCSQKQPMPALPGRLRIRWLRAIRRHESIPTGQKLTASYAPKCPG
jgi:hypothetical protein